MTDQDRITCAAAAARIDGQLHLGWLALALALAGWWRASGLLWPAAIALVAIAERYLALRLAIDRGLFHHLAQPAGGELAQLDTALSTLGLMPANTHETRPLPERLQGLQRWLRRHTMLVAVQAVTCAIAWRFA